MESLQHILVYITVFLATAFLIKKFFFPKLSILGQKKNSTKGCGQDGCGCH